MERVRSLIGGCVTAFSIAALLDVFGVILLFVGIFANVRIDGRFYGDFLIYTGALAVFASLAFWLMWYIGNIHVSEDDGFTKRSGIARLARKLSERLSQKLKGEPRVKCVEEGDGGDVAHRAGRVTWGRSTAYHNEGYEDGLDSPAVEQEEKTQI